MIKYIYFDVAGTLLYKPSLYQNIEEVLIEHEYDIKESDLKKKHKFLSEVIHFPDRTNESFYKNFNSELLLLLGVEPKESLLNMIFERCSYLPWEKFDDTESIKELEIPMGIISNFNSSLKTKLDKFFGAIFTNILVSEELGVAKPNIEFYKKAIEQVGFKATEILYIGDSMKLDFLPASSLGMNVLLIDRDNFYPNLKYKISHLNEISKFIL